MDQQVHMPSPTFKPSMDDTKQLMDWFDQYQARVLKNDLEAMADMAILPLIVMTNDSDGNAVTQEWDRETFKQALDLSAQGVDLANVSIMNERQPFFLSEDLAIVITDAVTSVAGDSQPSRYVDIMFKKEGEWKYKSMIQAGWGDMLKQYLA